MESSLTDRVSAATALLRRVAHERSPVAIASSFGAEDMVLVDLVARHRMDVSVFTLDTGRLPEETHALMEKVRERYGLRVEVYAPAAAQVEELVRAQGTNGFYRDVENRKSCCHVRKVLPLRRALAGKRAWVTGLRRAQSPTRGEVEIEGFDADHGLAKVNPLAYWSDADVWDYIRANSVPYNELHDKGYASIGCAPCTRAITRGEDQRAGRWWWESPESKECGLHVGADGRLARAAEAVT